MPLSTRAIGLVAMLAISMAASPMMATEVKVGGIGIVKPTYEGSDEYEVVGAPFVFPVFSAGSSGVFAINGADDVRLRIIQHQGFEGGILGGYAFGRDQDDGDLLHGLGDVDGGFVAGAYAGYRVGSALFDVSYHRIVSGDTGGYFRFGVTNTYRASERLKLKARVGTTYVDGDYMSEYFGITAAQSARSRAGLAAYDADAGFKDVHVGLTATYDLTPRWVLMSGVGYKRLIGDAADSPVVESEDQFQARFGVTYRFSIDGHRY